MKINILFLLFLLFSCFCSSCSDKTEHCLYMPRVFDEENTLSNRIKELFENYSFPEGVVPVLKGVGEIDSLHTGVFADKLFDMFKRQLPESDDFSKRGLLIVVSKNPELIQIRLGSKYKMYCNMNGVSSGVEYLQLQKSIAKRGIDGALPYFMENSSLRIKELNSLSGYRKMRLNNVLSAISDGLKMAGTPSESFYGKTILKPMLVGISWGFNLFKSWFFAFLIVTLGMFIIRYILLLGIRKLLRRTPHWVGICQRAVKWGIGLVFSISAAAAGIILSSGRMEDVIALHAIGIPFLENYKIVAEEFASRSSFWLVLFCLILYVLKRNLGSDIFQYSLLNENEQQRIYAQESEFRKSLFIAFCQSDVSKIDKSTEPYTDLVTDQNSKVLSGSLVLFAVALFYIVPKPLVMVAVVLMIFPLLENLLTTYKMVHWGNANRETVKKRYWNLGRNMAGMMVIVVVSVVSLAFSNPLPIKAKLDESAIVTELFAVKQLEGNYRICKKQGEMEEIMTGCLKKIAPGSYQLLVTGQNDPEVYSLTLKDNDMLLYSDRLGNGRIKYNKELNKIKIIFTINHFTVWEISK